MADRPFIFRGDGEELVLPVTPESYQVGCGINVEVVNIHELGDVIVTGYGTLQTIKISCLFPANDYPFSSDSDPDYYIQQFKGWVENKTRLRFIIGNTDVNVPVIVESFTYGERDGTGDVYAEITLREYREIVPQQVTTNPGASKARPLLAPKSGIKTYTTKAGDTLEAICRAEYGDGSWEMCSRLARYNGMIHTGLLAVGITLKIPKPLP